MDESRTGDTAAAKPDNDGRAVSYQARFTPQAWIRDYAVTVDAEGPTSWDCTREVTAHLGYFQRLQDSGYDGDWNDEVSGLLDNDDMLKGDPDAPAWVREWSGPFDIHVFRRTSTQH